MGIITNRRYTFKEYLENTIRLIRAHRKPTAADALFVELLDVQNRSPQDEKVFCSLKKRFRAKFNSDQALKKAVALMTKNQKNLGMSPHTSARG